MKNLPSVAIVVPIYKNSFSEHEEFSFYHNANILQNRDIFLIGPKRLESYIIELSKTIKNGHATIFDDKYFGSIKNNIKLMKSEIFYEKYIKYQYILICHFDVIVFEDQLDYWTSMDFDFIGAPLFYKADGTMNHLRVGGNGGFCLKKVKTHLNIIELRKPLFSILRTIGKSDRTLKMKIIDYLEYFKFYYIQLLIRSRLFEDSYWSEMIPSIFKTYKVASFELAKSFAFETNIRLLYDLNDHKLPMGIHAWWKYDEKFCRELISNKFPNIVLPGCKTNSTETEFKKEKINQ
jgi:hypothetical protein